MALPESDKHLPSPGAVSVSRAHTHAHAKCCDSGRRFCSRGLFAPLSVRAETYEETRRPSLAPCAPTRMSMEHIYVHVCAQMGSQEQGRVGEVCVTALAVLVKSHSRSSSDRQAARGDAKQRSPASARKAFSNTICGCFCFFFFSSTALFPSACCRLAMPPFV